jgi:hypothetical protein
LSCFTQQCPHSSSWRARTVQLAILELEVYNKSCLKLLACLCFAQALAVCCVGCKSKKVEKCQWVSKQASKQASKQVSSASVWC